MASDWSLTVSRATLTLAVIAMIIPSDKGLIDSYGICDSLAKAVTSERHDDDNSYPRQACLGTLGTLGEEGEVFNKYLNDSSMVEFV